MNQMMRVFLTAVFLMQLSPFAFAQNQSGGVQDPYGGPAEPQLSQDQAGIQPRHDVTQVKASVKAMDPSRYLRERAPKEQGQALWELREAAREYMLGEQLTRSDVAKSHSAMMDYGTEVVQILGQIVVDRASAQAYDLLKTKAKELLKCDKPTPRLDFKETCDTLDSVRLQDLATSPTPLYNAVAADGVRNVLNGLPIHDTRIITLMDQNVAALIFAAVKQAQGKADLGTPEELVSEFIARAVVDNKIVADRDLANVKDGPKAVLIASLSVIRCKQLDALSTQCQYNDLVDQFATAIAPGSADVRVGAKSLTKNLLVAVTRSSANTSIRPQYHAAVEAIFDATCMIESEKAIGCKGSVGAGVIPAAAPLAVAPPVAATATIPTLKALELAQNVALAAIDGEGNELIKSIRDVVNELADKVDQKKYVRALQICGSVLDYSATYTAKDQYNDAHQARQKILESLTTDMTNRTVREGDSIWSIGGSLRAAAGARFGRASSSAFYGPVSLPLGFGFQYASGEPAFHAEFSLIDIGQYVSSQEGGTVQSPNVVDALAPSITLGVAWGKQLPYFLAATGGYSPQYKFNDTDDKRGAFFAGVVFGIYVPFLDLN